MTDSTGAVRARYEYDPYGRQTKIQGDLEADFGFTGFYRHQASGLNLTKYRAYDPDLGRWTSRDPIGRRGGLNLYRYVANNPVNYLDPLGLSPLGNPYAADAWSHNPNRGRGDVTPGQAVAVLVGGVLAEVALTVVAYYSIAALLEIFSEASKDSQCPDSPNKPALPDDYWKNKKAPTQVPPGTERITDEKPSSRKNETYERTTYYDEYGRSVGQTHGTDHNEPEVHPNPHHHTRDPKTGQESGPKSGRHPND